MPVPWKGAGDVGTPMTEDQSNDIGNLYARINDIVQPVINDLWSHDSSHVAAAGFLINQPGSSSQKWHRDGPEEGSIDVFCPLIPLTELVGPTEVGPGTHTATTQTDDDNFENNSPKIIPLLQKGQILLFDYRTLHRGLGNKSDSTTRTLAYAVYKRGSSSMGDIRNFPDALTLEYD
jgi:ectoine hydroxylase-related dioxygenase (phytanoyl-CoA dioxygenase family)